MLPSLSPQSQGFSLRSANHSQPQAQETAAPESSHPQHLSSGSGDEIAQQPSASPQHLQQQQSASVRLRILRDQGIAPAYKPNLKKSLAKYIAPNSATAWKARIKKTFIEGEWTAFVEERAAGASANRIADNLYAQIAADQRLTPAKRQELRDYVDQKCIERHYIEQRNGNHVEGAVFKPDSTDLRTEIIRSQHGELFKAAGNMSIAHTTALSRLKRFKHIGQISSAEDAPETVMAKIRQAPAQNEAGQLETLERDYAIRQHASDREAPVSILNEFAKVGGKEYLFSDLARQGNLSDVLTRILNHRNSLSQPQLDKIIRTFAQSIIEAVNKMHRNRIYHRDLKLENFLLSDDGRIVVSDFSTAATENDRIQLQNGRWISSSYYDLALLGGLLMELSEHSASDRDVLHQIGQSLRQGRENDLDDVLNAPLFEADNLYDTGQLCDAVTGNAPDPGQYIPVYTHRR